MSKGCKEGGHVVCERYRGEGIEGDFLKVSGKKFLEFKPFLVHKFGVSIFPALRLSLFGMEHYIILFCFL